MIAPGLVGRIERRVLLDWWVDADVASRHLPPGLELRLVGGRAVVGVCLIRITDMRSRRFPAHLGCGVEAAAHRISVWGVVDGRREPGVYVPRRDTTSRAAVALGGRIWPGVHGPARIDVRTRAAGLSIGVRARDGARVDVVLGSEGPGPGVPEPARALRELHASERIAWSPGRRRTEVAVMECLPWAARHVTVDAARSSWIDDRAAFPLGAARVAGALLMEDVAVRWDDRVERCQAPSDTASLSHPPGGMSPWDVDHEHTPSRGSTTS